ncbi:response regulator [Undibacterium sp. TJN25]
MPTVLIADDNSDFRELLCELLSASGFEVLAAYDGEHAWDMLQSNKPDVILSDVDMPRLDGVALSIRVQNAPQTSHIPMVLLSGKPPPAKPAFVFDLIRKPVELEKLLAILNLALRATAGKD